VLVTTNVTEKVVMSGLINLHYLRLREPQETALNKRDFYPGVMNWAQVT
jgi:hypothetical protein